MHFCKAYILNPRRECRLPRNSDKIAFQLVD